MCILVISWNLWPSLASDPYSPRGVRYFKWFVQEYGLGHRNAVMGMRKHFQDCIRMRMTLTGLCIPVVACCPDSLFRDSLSIQKALSAKFFWSRAIGYTFAGSVLQRLYVVWPITNDKRLIWYRTALRDESTIFWKASGIIAMDGTNFVVRSRNISYAFDWWCYCITVFLIPSIYWYSLLATWGHALRTCRCRREYRAVITSN